MPYNVTLKLIAPRTTLQLTQPWSDVKSLKVRSFLYTTANTGGQYMLMQVTGWDTNSYFQDPSTNSFVPYTKMILMPPTTATVTRYVDVFSSYFDVIRTVPASFSNIEISLLINGVINNDISSSNPVFVELYCE